VVINSPQAVFIGVFLMSIQTYIAEAEATRRYSFRLKTVVPMDDAAVGAVERTLAKYMPHSVSRAKKTPIQAEPLDFRGIQNAEVWIIDFVLCMPGSAYVLQQDIRNALNIPDKYIIIRNVMEPGEQESRKIAALAEIDAEAEKLGLRAAPLLGDEESDDAKNELYGDAYNRGFLGFLRKVQTEREDQKVVTKSPLFQWVGDKIEQEPDQSTEDFNAGIKDAPTVGDAKDAYDDEDVDPCEVRKVFLDKNGKRVVLTRKIGE